METQNPGGRPTPEEARDALVSADAEESATRNRPVPVWYFPVLAALVLVLFLLNTIDGAEGVVRGAVIGLVLVIALSIAVLVGRVSLAPDGYHGVRIGKSAIVTAVLVAGALALGPVLLADHVGDWLWAVCGVAQAAVIAVAGIAYQRRTRA